MFQNYNFERGEYLPSAVLKESSNNKDTSTTHESFNIFLSCRKACQFIPRIWQIKKYVHRTSKLYLGQVNCIKEKLGALRYFVTGYLAWISNRKWLTKSFNPQQLLSQYYMRREMQVPSTSLTDHRNLLLLRSALVVVVMKRIRSFRMSIHSGCV